MIEKVIFFYNQKMEKENNIIIKMNNYNLKDNIITEEGGMEKDMILMVIKYLK